MLCGLHRNFKEMLYFEVQTKKIEQTCLHPDLGDQRPESRIDLGSAVPTGFAVKSLKF